MAIVKTKATKTGYHHGRSIWYGHYRIIGIGRGFEIGWTAATNLDGKLIPFEDAASAKAGAKECANYYWSQLTELTDEQA
jgi:hypothetical protein